ncbi:hypothetical protein ASPCAL10042 [Aspergillus calidoustus]|uniref:Ankyrin repeat protein n=1 Tax=Aspergillus calidoustus TaxID=454130 RepID=A0A0U5G6Q2_ASPCI|nr:hypothetical protein ASPCAL10042 [Aspergillus calidoustus]
MFHDRILDAFSLSIQYHHHQIATNILYELNLINRLGPYGFRRTGLLAAAIAKDRVNLVIAREILNRNMPVNMLGTPLEWACKRGSVKLVKMILANLMESKPDALAEYQDFVVRRGTEKSHSPSSHADNDHAFFLNKPMKICINAAN